MASGAYWWVPWAEDPCQPTEAPGCLWALPLPLKYLADTLEFGREDIQGGRKGFQVPLMGPLLQRLA
jgi:hypothetical protein